MALKKKGGSGRRLTLVVGVVYVRGEVFGEVVGPRKALATHLAVIGALARVDAQVPRQVTLATERSATEQTCKGALTRVFPHVQLEVFFGSDTFSTERTCKRAPFPLTLICSQP